MYAVEFVPAGLLAFVAVLVGDFFAIKLFHYHVPVQCGCRKTFESGLIPGQALRYVAVLVVTPHSAAFVFVECNYIRCAVVILSTWSRAE